MHVPLRLALCVAALPLAVPGLAAAQRRPAAAAPAAPPAALTPQ